MKVSESRPWLFPYDAPLSESAGLPEGKLILQALRKNQSTHQAVESALKRSLNNWETKQVSDTTHQIIELIEVEQKENLIFEG
ncbi:hypothetical protein CYANOKiyG1_23250 [Okeania sp. KiyG1]|nr:hypothetical protein CYANOKiyG1_23250 [Okeania sp. KiyG1]